MITAAEEIWAILHEVSQSQKANERKFEQFIEENAKRSEETDRKMQETDRIVKETSRQMKETDKKIKEVTTSIGLLGNKLMDFVEDIVRPDAMRCSESRALKSTSGTAMSRRNGVTRVLSKEYVSIQLVID